MYHKERKKTNITSSGVYTALSGKANIIQITGVQSIDLSEILTTGLKSCKIIYSSLVMAVDYYGEYFAHYRGLQAEELYSLIEITKLNSLVSVSINGTVITGGASPSDYNCWTVLPLPSKV